MNNVTKNKEFENPDKPSVRLDALVMPPCNQVLNMDCMEGIKTYPDNFFDIAIVDPPYGISDTPSRHKGSGTLKNRFLNRNADKFGKWDKKPTKYFFDELFRISKNHIIWGGNYFDLPPTRGIAIWDKQQPFENFSAFEYAWTSFSTPANMFRLATTRTGEKKIHPTQKPIKLYDWLIKNYGDDCQTILDTHVGSGSSRIAAHKAGKSFVGFEIDTDYWQAQEKRFKEFTSQLRMF
jgi:site-specific DNA-methyltransferase (adenine-specific)